jgi:ABC-type antimicrobial peptide transport system permease subunit
VRAIAGDVGRWVGVGIVAGMVAAVALGRYAHAALFGVTSTDGVSLVAAALVMAAVAAAGSLVPVLRATRIDPSTVLRD